MADFLAMEDGREHRQHRFYHHPRVPGAPRTDFHVGGVPGLRMESRIGQNDHRVGKLGNQGVKMRVMDISCRAVPGANQSSLVQDETQLATPNPPMIALPFFAKGSGARA